MTAKPMVNEIARTLNDIALLQGSLQRLQACVDDTDLAGHLCRLHDDARRVEAELLQYGADVARHELDHSMLKTPWLDQMLAEDVPEHEQPTGARRAEHGQAP